MNRRTTRTVGTPDVRHRESHGKQYREGSVNVGGGGKTKRVSPVEGVARRGER